MLFQHNSNIYFFCTWSGCPNVFSPPVRWGLLDFMWVVFSSFSFSFSSFSSSNFKLWRRPSQTRTCWDLLMHSGWPGEPWLNVLISSFTRRPCVSLSILHHGYDSQIMQMNMILNTCIAMTWCDRQNCSDRWTLEFILAEGPSGDYLRISHTGSKKNCFRCSSPKTKTPFWNQHFQHLHFKNTCLSKDTRSIAIKFVVEGKGFVNLDWIVGIVIWGEGFLQQIKITAENAPKLKHISKQTKHHKW